MATEGDLLEAFEYHSPQMIRAVLGAGISPLAPIQGKRPMDWLIEMYPRTREFAACVREMLSAGAAIDDPVVQAVLLDDEAALQAIPQAEHRKFSLVTAYTSTLGVSALHLCAEFNSVRCAKVLLEAGADVNAQADLDEDGFGGHTPIFHTVSSNSNSCRPMMELLADAGADLDVRVKGLVWGRGLEWETTIFDVTPISYAQCGLYRQFHRDERAIFGNIAYLWRKKYGVEPVFRNVPNKYVGA